MTDRGMSVRVGTGEFTQVEGRLGQVDERLAALDDRIRLRFESYENSLRASFEHELRRQLVTLLWAQVIVVMTMAALAFSLVRFT